MSRSSSDQGMISHAIRQQEDTAGSCMLVTFSCVKTKNASKKEVLAVIFNNHIIKTTPVYTMIQSISWHSLCVPVCVCLA